MSNNNVFLNHTYKLDTKIDIIPSSIHKLNPQFSLCDIDIMYTGDNRNMTNLEIDVIKEALYSLYGIPIVGEWLENEKCFGGHGISVEYKDGKIIEKVSTKPIGFVTKEAADNATFIKKKLPNGHEEKTWLHLEKCILWTSRYKEAQYIIDNGETSQSMEVNFEDGYYRDDGVFVATKIIFSALCAIGCEPCFEESKITRHYTLDSFKQEYNLMIEEFKKSNETDNNSVQDKKNNNSNLKGEINMDLTKFATLLSDIKYGDNCEKYSIMGTNENNIFVIDNEDFKIYSVNYAETEESGVIINWDTKKEADITYSEKSESGDVSVFATSFKNFVKDYTSKLADEYDKKLESQVKTISADAESRLNDMKDNYTDLQNSYSVVKEKLDKFEKIEAEKNKENHIAEAKKVIERFEAKIGKSPEFIYYKAKVDYEKVDINTMEKELTLMTGDILMNKKSDNKTFSYNPTVVAVKGERSKNNDVSSRYGTLLDNYLD